VLDDLLVDAAEVWRKGGFVMYVLAPVALLMWFGLGARIVALQRGIPLLDGRRDVRELLRLAREGVRRRGHGLVDTAAVRAVAIAREGKEDLRPRLEEGLLPLRDEAGAWDPMIKIAAVVAPLAGLLGTVSGMIETFDSLTGGAMHRVGGGGIGVGISEALFSTQAGLVVAIPGLLLGALLRRKQRAIDAELDRLIEAVCADEGVA
jgi:biopolymer transport protein ExbB